MKMHYVGNFDAERGQLNTISTEIDKELASIKQTLNELKLVWIDEKSEKFLSGTETAIKEVIDLKNQAIEDGNATLTAIQDALNIYEA